MAEKASGAGYRKPVIIAAGIVAVLLLLFTGVEVWLGHKARRIIEQKAAESGIRLEIGSVRVGLIGRSVKLDDVSLEADSGAVLLGDSSLRSVQLKLGQLALDGIHYQDKDGRKSIRLNTLSLKAPHAVLDRSVDSLRHAAPPKDSLPGVGKKASGLPALSIGQIRIEDGHVEYNLHKGSDLSTYILEGLQVQVDDFAPDSLAGEALLSGGNMRMALARLSYRFNDKAFLLEADTIALDSKPGTLSVASARLVPQYPKNQFAQQARGHADWTQFTSGPVTVSGLTFRRQKERPVVHADSLRVRDFSLDSYKNRQVPQTPRVKSLFFLSVQRLPFGLSLDKIYLQNLNATYEELSATGKKPGVISFNGLNAEFSGLTNLPSAGQPFYRLEASGRLMDTAALQATFMLPVDSLTNRFEVSGRLGRMPMSALNPALEPLAGAEIQQGTINSLNFKIQGTAARSTVNLTLLYDDLSVELVKDEHGKLKEKALASFLVDKFLLRTSNPDRRGLHQGTGSFERDPYRSQFNYLWKSLWPGIKKTLL